MNGEPSPCLLALGSNQPGPAGPPLMMLRAATAGIEDAGIRVVARSRIYRTAAVGAIPQPDYLNACIGVETALAPADLLERLLAIEARLGRRRGLPDAPRSIDIDLLAAGGLIYPDRERWHQAIDDRAQRTAVIPHPRLHRRRFVLAPLCDIAPDWHHPVCERSAQQMLDALDDDQPAVALGTSL